MPGLTLSDLSQSSPQMFRTESSGIYLGFLCQFLHLLVLILKQGWCVSLWLVQNKIQPFAKVPFFRTELKFKMSSGRKFSALFAVKTRVTIHWWAQAEVAEEGIWPSGSIQGSGLLLPLKKGKNGSGLLTSQTFTWQSETRFCFDTCTVFFWIVVAKNNLWSVLLMQGFVWHETEWERGIKFMPNRSLESLMLRTVADPEGAGDEVYAKSIACISHVEDSGGPRGGGG